MSYNIYDHAPQGKRPSGGNVSSEGNNSDAKIQKKPDWQKVLDVLKEHPDTSLGCSEATGILRDSVTGYTHKAVKLGRLAVLGTFKDKRTGRRAKFYTADKELIAKLRKAEPSLFDALPDEEKGGALWQ